MALAAVACGLLAACESSGTTTGTCISHYDEVASATTWAALKRAIRESDEWGRVASVRTQARQHVVGSGRQRVVRVVDLVDEKGRRLVQADVWRTDSGGWRAGVWLQCTD